MLLATLCFIAVVFFLQLSQCSSLYLALHRPGDFSGRPSLCATCSARTSVAAASPSRLHSSFLVSKVNWSDCKSGCIVISLFQFAATEVALHCATHVFPFLYSLSSSFLSDVLQWKQCETWVISVIRTGLTNQTPCAWKEWNQDSHTHGGVCGWGGQRAANCFREAPICWHMVGLCWVFILDV